MRSTRKRKSGFLALQKFIFSKYENIYIINIPRVNKYGLDNDIRRNSNGDDMKRLFGMNFFMDEEIAKIEFIEKQVLSSDYIIDLHEAKGGFRVMDKKGVGNTIITNNNNKQGQYIISKINESLENDKKFVLFTNKKSIQFSLRDFCNQNNIKYCLVEVSKSQNLEERESICEKIITLSIEWLLDNNSV